MENTENYDIVLLVAIGCAAMTLLAGFIIFFVVLYQKKVIIQRNEVEAMKAQHQRELLQKTLEVEEKERERVAKNIHDDLGALISILRLNNSRTAKNIGNSEILTKIHKENNIILNKTSESVRSISKKLASPTLIKLGYIKALREVCNNFNQTGEIRMDFFNELEHEFTITPQRASHLFRASQEIINNIIKHAAAHEIAVRIYPQGTQIGISFTHDGNGISEQDVKELMKQDKGLGLVSIRSRLNIIGAALEYLAPEEEHASITITYLNDEKED